MLFSLVFIYSKYALSSFNFIKLFLLIQTTVLLAAAGNIINDYFDVETDKINKPNKVLIGKVISGKNSLLLYLILNFFGLVSGLTLAFINNKIIYGLLFIVISALLYLYSKDLKKTALLGNLIVSIFIGLSIYIILIFHPFDNVFFSNIKGIRAYIIIYSLFAFMINFIREMVKDIEDINGDYSQNMKTLPIIIGRKRTQNIIFYLSSIPLLSSIVFISFLENILIGIYFTLFIIIPLGYFMYQIKEAKHTKTFHKLSTLLKIIMLLGILSIILVVYFT